MRNHKLMRGVATLGLLAGSFVAGASAIAGGAGATVVKAHPAGTYNLALVASKQREIWPYVDPQFFTVTNASDTQQPMYRPLVWVGLGSSITVQYPLSLITAAPLFNAAHTSLHFSVKNWAWSNGEHVTGADVKFWFNLAKSEPTNYGGYSAHVGIPDQVSGITVVGQNVTVTLNHATNSNWFLYNALATVTPLPMAWDATALGIAGGNCSALSFALVPKFVDATHGVSQCSKVYDHFASIQLGTAYRTHNLDPIFQVTDGPYHITSYFYASSSAYTVVLQPSATYSGPVKAHVNVQFHWFGSIASEILALQAGNVLSRGGVTPDMVTVAPSGPGSVGHNLDSTIGANYNPVSGKFWGFDYAYFNFNGVATHQKLINQQYIRAAMEQAINQAGIITTVYNGYATTNCQPTPNMVGVGAVHIVCPYPFNVVAAKTLLTSHGWDISTVPATCTNPGTGPAQCGAGIALNDPLSLNYEYASGGATASIDLQVAIEKVEWARIGMDVTLSANTDGSIGTDCLNDDPAATFDVCQYGGWVYSPGAYPSGEQFFLTGAASNTGFVNDTTLNNLILATDYTSVSLSAYATYAAHYLPVLYQPSSLGVGELKKTVHGAQPPNPISDFNPEYITAV